MPKRLLDCCASDFRGFSKAELLESIQKSEGRVIACETIGTVQPLLGNVTNAEFAASMGADILLLNLRFSFYGIITVGFEVHLVGQVGVLATFGVEIVARSGEPYPGLNCRGRIWRQ